MNFFFFNKALLKRKKEKKKGGNPKVYLAEQKPQWLTVRRQFTKSRKFKTSKIINVQWSKKVQLLKKVLKLEGAHTQCMLFFQYIHIYKEGR